MKIVYMKIKFLLRLTLLFLLFSNATFAQVNFAVAELDGYSKYVGSARGKHFFQQHRSIFETGDFVNFYRHYPHISDDTEFFTYNDTLFSYSAQSAWLFRYDLHPKSMQFPETNINSLEFHGEFNGLCFFSINYRLYSFDGEDFTFHIQGVEEFVDCVNDTVIVIKNSFFVQKSLNAMDEQTRSLNLGHVFPGYGFVLHPDFRVNGRYLLVSDVVVPNSFPLRAILTDGNTIYKDTLYTDVSSTIYTNLLIQTPQIVNQHPRRALLDVGAKRYIPIHKRSSFPQLFQSTGDFFWLGFDEHRDRFTLSNLHYFRAGGFAYHLGKLNGNELAFGHVDSSGIQLLKLDGDTVYPLTNSRELGMYGIFEPQVNEPNPLINAQLLDDDFFYFVANHARFGLSLYRTDGTEEGTGVIASLFSDDAFTRVSELNNLHILKIQDSLQVFMESKSNKVYMYKYVGDNAFIQDTLSDLQHSRDFMISNTLHNNFYFPQINHPAFRSYSDDYVETQAGYLVSYTTSRRSQVFFPLSFQFLDPALSMNEVQVFSHLDYGFNIVKNISVEGAYAKAILNRNGTIDMVAIQYVPNLFVNGNHVSSNSDASIWYFKFNNQGDLIFNNVIGAVGAGVANAAFRKIELTRQNNTLYLSGLTRNHIQFGNQNISLGNVNTPFYAAVSMTGTPLWVYVKDLDGFQWSSSPFNYQSYIASSDDVVYFATSGRNSNDPLYNHFFSVTAIQAETGELVWNHFKELPMSFYVTGLTISDANFLWMSGGCRCQVNSSGLLRDVSLTATDSLNGFLWKINRRNGNLNNRSLHFENSFVLSIDYRQNYLYTSRLINENRNGQKLYGILLEKRNSAAMAFEEYMLTRLHSPFNPDQLDSRLRFRLSSLNDSHFLVFTTNSSTTLGRLWHDTRFKFPLTSNDRASLLARRPISWFKLSPDYLFFDNTPDSGLESMVRIFPNPYRQGWDTYLYILIDVKNYHRFSSYLLKDLQGRNIYSGEMSNTQSLYRLPLSGLRHGVYLVHIFSGDELVLTRKVIIK
jgi:ELWxxDGT repeat protein